MLRIKVKEGEMAIWCSAAKDTPMPHNALRISAPADVQHQASALGFAKKNKHLLIACTSATRMVYEVYRL